jgi:hypothetical protein
MRISGRMRGALGTALSAAILAGCGGTQNGAVPQGVTAQSRVHQASGSWMSAEAQSEDLLYASVQTTCCAARGADVYVFSYPQGKLVGELNVTKDTMFGLCSDRRGHVYVTSFNTSGSGYSTYIYKYRHGEAHPIAKFLDPWSADACSVDPTTGNLAVANWYTGYSKPEGNVLVYDQATGKYTLYSSPQILYYKWCAYDASGNLYVDGEGNSGTSLAVLPKGQNAFSGISLNRSNFVPYSLQWYANDLVIAGYEGSIGPETLLKVHLNGTKASIVRSTILKDAGQNWGADSQFVIRDQHIISGGYPGYYLHAWYFPKGGYPFQRIARTPDGWWYGIAISPGNHRTEQ